VETLVTIQAENLGTVAEAPTEGSAVDIGRANELAKASSALFVCDAAPPTLELLRNMASALAEAPSLRILSASPKRVEVGVPELKGKVSTLPPPIPPGEGEDPVYAQEAAGPGAKLFLGTAKPDPLFGILDTRAEACLNWVARSHSIAARAQKSMEPEPFKKTEAYDAVQKLTEGIPESKYITIVPSGGKPKVILEDAPFDAVRNSFSKIPMPQTRGIVIGAGGRGYDDTFSSALRGVWNVLDGVRRTGSVLLIAECSEGPGSIALEMLVTGRMAGDGERRRERYVDGLEEVFYLNKLKEEYDMLLLSGLPETYARSKLGLTTARGSGEAVGRMLNKVGRSGKLNVVPRASECLVVSG
jgi:hypothetical protein